MSPFRSLLLVAALASAALAGAQVKITTWKPENGLNWSVVTSGAQSGFNQPSFQVLNSENDFQMYWRGATGQAPQTAPKGVNWLKEKVIAIHLGQRPSGGYSVVVNTVVKNGASATVYATERMPEKGQWVSEQMTSPYVIIRVERTASSYNLTMEKQTGGSTGGVTVYGPGLFRYNPNNYDRVGGGGFVDPKYAADWSVYRSGTRSQITRPRVQSINGPAEWQRYYNELTGNPSEPAPVGIDWGKYRLVALNLGQRPTTGFGIEVVNIERRGSAGVIRAVEVVPVPGSRIRQRATSPFIILKVQREISQFNVDLNQREGNGDLRYNDGL